MTQEEVELIYNYLHENYEYIEGLLIRKKKIPGVPLKQKGCFSYNNVEKRMRPSLFTQFTINKKTYYFKLSHAIYLYHYKIKPKKIFFRDKNVTNTRIENLYECDSSEYSKKENWITSPKGFSKNRSGTFTVTIVRNKGEIFIGNYHDKNEAKKAYLYGKDLLLNYDLNLKEIRSLILIKYPLPIKNKNGYKGIKKLKNGKFIAIISFSKKSNKKQIRIGYFETAKEAYEVYIKAKEDIKNETIKAIPATSS